MLPCLKYKFCYKRPETTFIWKPGGRKAEIHHALQMPPALVKGYFLTDPLSSGSELGKEARKILCLCKWQKPPNS